jgi:predicted DNA-binding WGR domain protein
MTTNYTISAARQARRAGAPWRIRIEYRGWTDKGNRSEKFWECSGEGYGSCRIRWGKLGSYGQSTTKPFSYVEDKLPGKLRKGYNYARGVQETYEAPKPKAPAKPKPAPLTGPFALIKSLKAIPGGFHALDANGSVLFELPEAGGFSLRETYGIPVVG